MGLQNLFAQLALCGSQPLYKVVLINCRQTIKLLIYLFSLIAHSWTSTTVFNMGLKGTPLFCSDPGGKPFSLYRVRRLSFCSQCILEPFVTTLCLLEHVEALLIETVMLKSSIVMHTFNPNTRETVAGGSLWVQGQPYLQIEFQDSQDYVERPCFKWKKYVLLENVMLRPKKVQETRTEC